MEVSQLRTLLQVAELGSLNKAAGRLRIAQPALSRQIRLLEEELGARLFDRHGRGMIVTETGREVVDRAAHIIAEIDALKGGVSALGTTLSGRVCIGVPPTVADLVSVPLYAAFASTHPNVTLQLVSAYTGFLLDGLYRGDIDVAVLYDPKATRTLRSLPLMTETLFLIGDAAAGLSQTSAIAFPALGTTPLFLPSVRHGLRTIVDRFAREAGIELDIAAEIDSYTALKDLVRLGYGRTILPLAAIHDALAAGHLTAAPLVAPAPMRRLVLSYPMDRPTSRAATFAGETIVRIASDLVDRGIWVGAMQTRD
jgi:LysR family nitrogen assimilation transcriptional regulator